MDILTKKLPEGVLAGGRFYPVFTDFKNWIRIAELLKESETKGIAVFAKIFPLCYKEMPETFEEAVSGVMDFFSGGEKEKVNEREKGSRREPQIFSFSEDSWLIYAAFLSQYGIDLLKETLHWHQFLALFKALSGEHKLFKVISYRTAKLSDIKDREKRLFYAKMKRLYSLKDNRTEEEKSGDIAMSLAEVF